MAKCVYFRFGKWFFENKTLPEKMKEFSANNKIRAFTLMGKVYYTSKKLSEVFVYEIKKEELNNQKNLSLRRTKRIIKLKRTLKQLKKMEERF